MEILALILNFIVYIFTSEAVLVALIIVGTLSVVSSYGQKNELAKYKIRITGYLLICVSIVLLYILYISDPTGFIYFFDVLL